MSMQIDWIKAAGLALVVVAVTVLAALGVIDGDVALAAILGLVGGGAAPSPLAPKE